MMPLSSGFIPVIGAVTLPFLGELVALLCLSALIAYLCQHIHIPPIAGFLLTGVLIGPSVLGLVPDRELIDMMAEVGVILLLFTIGVEFSLEHLARLSREIFVGGSMQVGLTTGGVALLLMALDVAWRPALYTGALVALSSTAIVLGLLDDRGETDSPKGRISLAVLIFQDLAIIVMVLLVPLLGGGEGSTGQILLALGEAVLVVSLVVWLARSIIPHLLNYVARARRQEIFVLAVVAICLGTAWLTSLVGVSLALGAFLAGLLVSESQFREHALSEIIPFRAVFSAIFFVSVGMLLDTGFVYDNLFMLLGVVAAVFLLKTIITAASVLALGYPARVAMASAFTLAQIGEFSFVLERAGQVVGLTPAGFGLVGQQTFIAGTVLLMLLTPVLVRIGPRVGEILQNSFLGRFGEMPPAADGDDEIESLEDHVILVGYGPAGCFLGQALADTHIPFVVIEMNPTSVEKARQQGLHAFYGDASRSHILEAANIERAKMCVVLINDHVAARRITHVARHLNPTLQIVVRTQYLADLEPFHQAGADVVVPEEMEAIVRVFSHVLGGYQIPSERIEEYLKLLRTHDYERMQDDVREAHLMVLEGLDEEGLHTRAVSVRPGAPVVGHTLEELNLRKKYRLTVLAVRRNGKTLGNPSGDFRLEVGDRLVLIGRADQFATCADLFREPSDPQL